MELLERIYMFSVPFETVSDFSWLANYYVADVYDSIHAMLVNVAYDFVYIKFVVYVSCLWFDY